MPIKIAFDENFLTKTLIESDVNFPSEEFPDVYNIKSPNGGVLKSLLNNRCDIALLDVVEYGLAQSQGDVRIIKAPALCLSGNCGIAGINFKQGASEIKSIGPRNAPPILHRITSILLSERYDIDSSAMDVKDDADVIITEGEPTLDLSEDWMDSFANPLPLYFWCARSEELSISVEKAVELLNVLCKTNSGHIQDGDTRSGEVKLSWRMEMENEIDEALENFFYHGILPEIYASKFYGDAKE